MKINYVWEMNYLSEVQNYGSSLGFLPTLVSVSNHEILAPITDDIIVNSHLSA